MRYLTAFALAMLFAGVASSQGRFGLKAGIVLHYLDTKGTTANGTYNDMKVGGTIGASYEMQLTNRWQIQPEINFVRLSADETLSNSTIRLNYVTIPVLFKALTDKKTVGFYLGPQLSFLGKAINDSPTGEKNIRKQINQTGFDAVAGVEFVTPINVTVNVRYVYGTTNVFRAEFDTFKSRHQYGAITLGYLFGKKK
jgi:opacity protein-like surface antigen